VRSTDIDEFVEMVRGYHLRFMQIDKGPFIVEGVQTQLAGVLLSAVQYGRAVVHSGEPPSGKITFAVGTSKVPALWQGRSFGPHDVLVITPGVEIDMVSRAAYGVATASFPPELVEKTADCLGWRPTAHASTNLVVALKHNRADMLRATLDAAIHEIAARPFNERAAAWALSKQEDLLRALLQCISDSAFSTQSASNGERARVLKAATLSSKIGERRWS
jgi:hypothetical protein